MATITEEQRKNLFKQLQEIQKTVGGIQEEANRQGFQSPSSTNFSGLNSAQQGGASGVGFESPQNQNEIARQVGATLNAGGSKSQAGEKIRSGQAQSLVRSSGLEGIIAPDALFGLTVGEAAARIQEERSKRTAQSAPGTSAVFNPEILNRTRRAVDKFNFALDESIKDPFDHRDIKLDKQKNVISTTSREIGELFNSTEELFSAYQQNPEFKNTVDTFLQKGGKIDDIAKNITAPVVGQEPGNNTQTPTEFLSRINNPQANKEAELKAFEELAPEREVTQLEILRQAQIPQDLKNLYFGNEQEIGILEAREENAKEEKRILEEREKDANRTARDQARLQIQKNDAEAEATKAKIEKNRLAAKNYMTAKLAKLGALTTTGAAPLALQTLETQYQQQVNDVETKYRFANEDIKIGLDADLDEIENRTDELILSIQEDLDLGTEKVAKEILKAQQAADKEIYKLTEQYTRRFRERTTKYTTELEKAAEAYAKKYAKTAAGGLDVDKLAGTLAGYDEGEYIPEKKGVLLPSGKIKKMSLTDAKKRDVEAANLRGVDTINYFITLPDKFRNQFIQEQIEDEKNVSLRQLQSRFKKWKASEAESKPHSTKQGPSSAGSGTTGDEEDEDLYSIFR